MHSVDLDLAVEPVDSSSLGSTAFTKTKLSGMEKHMLNCIWTGCRTIPWWAWLTYGVGAIVLAIISRFIGDIATLILL
ncbi:MAG: hypothetical protein NTW42_00845 [Deltaproteobacteria bacterium]|nr:hypothetical protein [Deltaproteobacteria bacterium]